MDLFLVVTKLQLHPPHYLTLELWLPPKLIAKRCDTAV
jgi:hypothetical protein